MFKTHVEKWLDGKAEHVQEYIGNMLEECRTTLDDFQNEQKVLTTKMEASKMGDIEYSYSWSIRDWIGECIRWYKAE